jgi:muconolactone delta-isomerase
MTSVTPMRLTRSATIQLNAGPATVFPLFTPLGERLWVPDWNPTIIYIEREVPGVLADAFAPYLQEEAAHAWQLYQAGIIRELYFRQDERSAVLSLECPDVQEARRQLQSLPLVQAGLISFEVIPLIAYPGFARLFGEAPHTYV